MTSPEMLARYLAGDLSEEESERMLARLKEDPDMRADLEGVSPRMIPDVDTLLKGLRDGRVDRPSRWRRDRRPAIAGRRLRWTTAATAVIVVLIGVISVTVVRQQGDERTYLAAAGMRNVFTLDDGSEVILNAASELSVSSDFGRGRRAVELIGEGYFNIRPDSAQPFVIRASDVTVTVLGTAFNVNAYGDEPPAIIVAEGRVGVKAAGGHAAELNPGERGQLDPEAGQIVVDRASVEDAVAWTEGRIVFRGALMTQVVRRLEREYDVRILMEPGVGSKRLDASFEQQPIDQVASLIATALGIRADVDGDTVRFSEREATP